jgi:molybdenum cofactor cytidylyltransferase
VETLGAVILAAGGSKRLGYPKQFLTHAGRSLVARAVDAARDCAPIVVVGGRESREIEMHLHGPAVSVVHHQGWERGIGSSIRAGVSHILEMAPDLDAIVILVCDQPHVTAETVSALRALREKERKAVVACEYAGSPGVPALFDRSAFAKLRRLSDQSGAKSVILQSKPLASLLPFPQGAIDIDTSEDAIRHLHPIVRGRERLTKRKKNGAYPDRLA